MTTPVQTTPKSPVKAHIRTALASALRLMVTEGLTISDAAQRVGMARESLSRALTKPHVIAAKAGVKRAWMINQTGKAWLTVANLAENAVSEDVRLKASRVILDAAGELEPRDTDDRVRRPMVNIVIQHPGVAAQVGSLPGIIEARVHHVRPEGQGGVIEAPRA